MCLIVIISGMALLCHFEWSGIEKSRRSRIDTMRSLRSLDPSATLGMTLKQEGRRVETRRPLGFPLPSKGEAVRGFCGLMRVHLVKGSPLVGGGKTIFCK